MKPVFICAISRHVIRALGDHRANHSQLVRALSQIRQQIADPQPALTALFEFEHAAQQVACLPEERGHIERLSGPRESSGL